MVSVLVAQLSYNPTDISSNSSAILSAYTEATKHFADIALCSRLALSGYVEESPLLSGEFFSQSDRQAKDLAIHTQGKKTCLIFGGIENKENTTNETIYLASNGILTTLISTPLKTQAPYSDKICFNVNKYRVLLIMEESFELAKQEALCLEAVDLFLLMGKSSGTLQKYNLHQRKCTHMIYMNVFGGYQDKVFPGNSFVCHQEKVFLLPAWKEEKTIVDFENWNVSHQNVDHKSNLSQSALDYQSLMLALSDYVHKSRFTSILLGMSGGIDSALVSTIAADALGPEKVYAFMLPTRYTSNASIVDARTCSNLLGIHYDILYIEDIFSTTLKALEDIFRNHHSDVTEENIQSRIRGLILMAISNKKKLLLLSTGNKSELLTGYTTLYGDTCGGFAPLKDVYKTHVYELARWRNDNIPSSSLCRKTQVIPQEIIKKFPSAELNHNQKDQDTLPDYPILDAILYLLIDKGYSKEEAISAGYSKEHVALTIRLIEKSTFKVKQTADGPLLFTPQSAR